MIEGEITKKTAQEAPPQKKRRDSLSLYAEARLASFCQNLQGGVEGTLGHCPSTSFSLLFVHD